MIGRIVRAVAVLALVGCGGGPVSDYTLNLVPHVLTGQDPFVDGRVIELVVIEESGATSVHAGGAIAGGQAEIPELPPIPAGAAVGVLIEEAGGAGGAIDADLAIAWGSAVAPEPLEVGGNTVTLDVLVAEIGHIGDMGKLPSAQVSLGAGAAMAPGGDVFLFGGGSSNDDPTDQTDRVLHMTGTDSGTWSFEKLSVKMTDRDGVAGRYGVAASTVFVDGNPMIFVSGGRAEPGHLGAGTDLPTQAAYLFNPTTLQFDWGTKDTNETLTVARSEHDHLVLDNDQILIYGGFSANLDNSMEMFNPKKKTFEYITGGFHGAFLPAAAGLGAAGAMVCGGGQAAASVSTPTDACTTITLAGVMTQGDAMPQAVMGHAMAHLADGRILATGGITQSVPDNQSAAAVRDAWIYDGKRWTALPAKMKNARAMHAIIAMPDGNAVIVGGTENAGPIFALPGPAVTCPELFDAKASAFIELTPCTNAGAGANPPWASLPTEGAFVLAGDQSIGGAQLGDAFGYIGFTPPVQ